MPSLTNLTYAEIIADVRRLRETAQGPRYRIAILSNVLVNALSPVLEWLLLQEGIAAEIHPTTFDNIVQDSAALREIDAAIVFMDMAGFASGLADSSSDEAAIGALGDTLDASVVKTLENLRAAPLVIFNSFSALPFEAQALKPRPLGLLAERLNRRLRASDLPNLLPVDLDKVYAATGLAAALDFRQFHSARALHTVDFFKAWAAHVLPAFRSAAGRARKVLVVDCDNTLWGGIVGEDGIEGLRLDERSRDGPFFREAQQIMKGWQRQGVLLAIASKNNPEDVAAVLREHPAMSLREVDFVAVEVGWGEKIDSLRRVAEALNVGMDSLVFLDDSPFELERIKASLPQVACLQAPRHASAYPAMLRQASGLFFNLSQSEEDARRTRMYREESERKGALAQFQSLDDYLAALQVKVDFVEGPSISAARAAQMSQKTNQFNLTTQRYTEADITRMVSDPDMIVATFSVADRFGDYGVTGLIILRLDRVQRSAALDTFLMSCRVLGRRVETTVMEWIFRRLAQASCVRLDGEYRPTQKNAQVADLLDRMHFQRVSDVGGRIGYRLDLPG